MFFTLDNVKYASKSFPFDVHYASAVFESWEEIDNLKFLPAHDSVESMLGNPHETPLFPLPDFNLVAGGDVLYGNEKVNLDAGMCVWTFVRSYESDIFTSQGDARKTGANFCNLVITFVLRRRALRQPTHCRR